MVATEVIHIFVKDSNADAVAEALKVKADPNARDPRGLPPLTYALAAEGDAASAMSRSLLEHGAIKQDACQCKEDYFSPRGINGTDCYACPEGAVCLGYRDMPHAEAGFMELTNHRFVNMYPSCAASFSLCDA